MTSSLEGKERESSPVKHTHTHTHTHKGKRKTEKKRIFPKFKFENEDN